MKNTKNAWRWWMFWTTGINIHYCWEGKFVVYLWKTKQQNIFFFMKKFRSFYQPANRIHKGEQLQFASQNPLTGEDMFLFKNSHIASWRIVSICREVHMKIPVFCLERVVNYKNAFSYCGEALVTNAYTYIILWKDHRNNFQVKSKKITFWKLICGTGSPKDHQ